MRRILSSLFLYFLTEFLSKQLESGLILKMVPLVAVIVVVLILLAWIIRTTKTKDTKKTRSLL